MKFFQNKFNKIFLTLSLVLNHSLAMENITPEALPSLNMPKEVWDQITYTISPEVLMRNFGLLSKEHFSLVTGYNLEGQKSNCWPNELLKSIDAGKNNRLRVILARPYEEDVLPQYILEKIENVSKVHPSWLAQFHKTALTSYCFENTELNIREFLPQDDIRFSHNCWILLTNPSIKIFPSHDEELQAAQLALFSNNLEKTRIKYLYLNSFRVGPYGSLFLASKIPISLITQLYLPNSQLRGEEIQNLARYLPSSKIEHLDLSQNNLGDLEKEDISYLTTIMQAPRLKILSLGKNNLGRETIFLQNLAQDIESSNLNHLDLSLNEIKDESAESLIRIVRKLKLNTLILAGNHLRFLENSAEILSKGLKDLNLKRLSLSRNIIEDEGFLNFIRNFSSINMKALSFSYNEISENCLNSNIDLIKNSFLEVMDIRPWFQYTNEENLIEQLQGENIKRVLLSQIEGVDFKTIPLAYDPNHYSLKGAKNIGLLSEKIYRIANRPLNMPPPLWGGERPITLIDEWDYELFYND